MRLMVNRELEREILSYGEHLRVKAPEHFRQRIILLHKTLSEASDDSAEKVL